MAKLTYGQIINSLPALRTLFQHRFRAARGMQLKALSNQINDNFKSYHEARIELCKTHGDLNAETNNYDIRPEEKEAFELLMAELEKGEVEIKFQPLKANSLGEVQLSVFELEQLDWLIVD